MTDFLDKIRAKHGKIIMVGDMTVMEQRRGEPATRHSIKAENLADHLRIKAIDKAKKP